MRPARYPSRYSAWEVSIGDLGRSSVSSYTDQSEGTDVSKKPTKLIGLSINGFDELVAKGEEIHLRPAHLLPLSKPGDEMALTSVFLSGLRLIKEFRHLVFQAIGMRQSTTMRFYTEAEFVLFKRLRIDGLILTCRANKIIDAVLIEVKNKSVELDAGQISDYLGIAKEYGVTRLLTVSNQFVSYPTQSPVHIKPPKQVAAFHLSWSYILTIAHILLAKNSKNIENADQVEIMKELVDYFEADNSGILGFSKMKPGWVEITKKANAGTSLKLSDVAVDEAVSSWLQEERDMALILSRKLGLLVESGQKKFRHDLPARAAYEKKVLATTYTLESSLQVDGAVSSLQIKACFDRKNIEMYSTLMAPLDKKTRGQLSWIKNQLIAGKKKNPELFASLRAGLFIEVNLKYGRDPLRFQFDDLDAAIDEIAGRDIRSFNVLYFQYLGRKFESRKGVVLTIEKMLLDYYQGVFQHLKRWEKRVPQIKRVADEETPA